jgi:hypothetical protein
MMLFMDPRLARHHPSAIWSPEPVGAGLAAKAVPPRRVLRLFLELVRDRERGLVLLDAGVEDLVVEQ